MASGFLGEWFAQRRGFLLRLLELADQERGLHDADPRPQAQRRIVGVGREAKRTQRASSKRVSS